ncbi:carboxymuconolactone decarboxylase family protein [Marinivivus vitaminiproducens]|uniref:carboxymuconolactone decarboxylase family protein n=1 Tax=Marinivivus vitaminiproducens TaxID=3035935 RepID=UPI0027987C8E|nr:carboxymuconolactone decarboxylase family protein [Geminicoccaceae bacterium SCSIO 64248]
MSRLPNLSLDTMSDEQKQVHATITSGPRGSVRGPLAVWLQCPELASRAQALGEYCRYNTSLPPRLSELAIITTAAQWQANYEWHAHAKFANQEGLSDAIIEAIRVGDAPSFDAEDERIVHRLATELYATREVSDETWAAAQQILGPQRVMDLIGILGYYALISMTVKSYRIPLPDGVSPYFPNASGSIND